MKILFLDQSGNLGGAELCLADIAKPYRDRCLVGIFADGSFRTRLEDWQIPVEVLAQSAIQVSKDSSLMVGLRSIQSLMPLVARVVDLARQYDVIYANTQKALVVGALASVLSRRPLIYHLHDILSPEHFSTTNRRIAVTLANRFARVIIANSEATRTAFVAAGGESERVAVVYNGFEPETYQVHPNDQQLARQSFGLNATFVIGHFSRLSPWKGQHILLEALAQSPIEVGAVFVGDALFGEHAYVEQLHQQVHQLGLENRVRFLGFQSAIAPLMAACDLIVHSSTAPEPFGRVIVEAMLCRKPVIAAQAGGAIELVEHGRTGWLCLPANSDKLAELIRMCQQQPELAATVAEAGYLDACQRFTMVTIQQQLSELLTAVTN
jgi:glycosyltransferase involved in cell wall biosynthesis